MRNYRATPHSSTNVSPNQLMFKTKSSTAKLPVYRSKKIDSECLAKYAQLNEKSAKQTMKQYADKKLKTAVTEYTVGNLVLLKQNKTHKNSTTYDPSPFVLVNLNGTQAVIKRDNQIFRRNSSMIKKFLGEGERESVGPNNSITVAIDDQNE